MHPSSYEHIINFACTSISAMQMLSINQSGYDEGVIHVTVLFLNAFMIIVSCLERHSAAARVKSERVGATIRKNKNSMCANPLK